MDIVLDHMIKNRYVGKLWEQEKAKKKLQEDTFMSTTDNMVKTNTVKL
jgi:hypothetical protein